MPAEYSFPVPETAPKNASIGAESAPIPSAGNRTTCSGAETAPLIDISGGWRGCRGLVRHGPGRPGHMAAGRTAPDGIGPPASHLSAPKSARLVSPRNARERNKPMTNMTSDDIIDSRLCAIIRRKAESLGNERKQAGFKNGEVADAALIEAMSIAGGTASQVRQRPLRARRRSPARAGARGTARTPAGRFARRTARLRRRPARPSRRPASRGRRRCGDSRRDQASGLPAQYPHAGYLHRGGTGQNAAVCQATRTPMKGRRLLLGTPTAPQPMK